MSTHVTGFRPPDAKFQRMKAIWDACAQERIAPPADVEDFFKGESPDPAGVVVDIRSAVKEFNADMQDGYEIDITKLPHDVKVIRVFNSY